jgi:hypothetical protein
VSEMLALMATIVGTIASVIGVVIAVVQTVRIRELRRHTEADTWEGIRILRSAYHFLERSAAAKAGDPDVREARGKVTESIRHFIKQAALAERHFSEATIEQWKKLGRIEADWHIQAARMHLPQSEAPRTAKR